MLRIRQVDVAIQAGLRAAGRQLEWNQGSGVVAGLAGFAFRCAKGVVNGLGGAAFAGFSGFIVENPQQVVAALGGSEGEPGVAGAGLALEERAEDGRRGVLAIPLAFESLHKHFGDFAGALFAGGGGFGLVGKLAEFAATRVAQGIEEPAELTIGVECASELGRERNGALDEIRFEPDLDARADSGFTGGLHLFVDEEKVAAVTGIGEERSAEGVASDFSADATAIADRPGFGDVEWNARDDPLERGSVGLEKRGEGFAW
jgi:hypothetical protein